MYLCFELMTLLSVALVLHSLTKEAVAAGMKYLLYSIAGAMMGLLGIFFFTANAVTPCSFPAARSRLMPWPRRARCFCGCCSSR